MTTLPQLTFKNAQSPLSVLPATPEPTPFDMLAIVRRRIWLIVGVAFVTVALSIMYLMMLTPRYAANAQILLGEQGLSNRSTFDFLEAQALSNSVIEGELAVLRSGALLVRVSQKLNLENTPEFNAALRPPERPVPVLAQVQSAVAWVRSTLTPAEPESEGADESGPSVIAEAAAAGDPQLRENDAIVEALRRKIDVRQLGSSFVVQVSVGSEDPVMAAAITNTLMEEYIGFLTDKRFKAAQRFTNWLEQRVAELAVKLEESEQESLAFRSVMESGADSRERLEQQMREMTSKVVDARASLAFAAAQAARTSAVAELDGPLAAADILSSEEILRYRNDLGDLKREAATAAINFGEGSLQTISISRAITKIEDSIAIEVNRAIEQLRNRAEVSGTVVQSLEGALRQLETLVLSQSSDGIKLNQLERVADANRRVYEEFLGRFKETSEIQNLRAADAEVISYASPPTGAAYPRKKVGAVLAAVGGVFGGLAIAFLLELAPPRITNAGQLTRVTGLPIFGQVPKFPFKGEAKGLLSNLERRPSSPFVHSARRLLSDIDMAGDAPTRSIVVSGVGPGSTKNSVAVMLGWAVMQTGRSCVVVDADTRTASLSHALQLNDNNGPPRATLIEVLYDQVSLDQAVHTIGASGLHVMACKPTGSDPALIFKTARAGMMVEDLLAAYDVVIIDAPLLLGPSDAFTLPIECDLGLFIAEANKTSCAALEAGLVVLKDTGIARAGAVLTNFKFRENRAT